MGDTPTDTLDPDTPDTQPTEVADTPAEPQVDWHKRYEDLQPEYTRATQTLSDEERLLAHIEQKFPHLLAEDDTPDTPRDPEPSHQANDMPPELAELRQQTEQLTQWQQQQEAAQAAQQFQSDLQAEVGERELSDIGLKYVQSETFANGADRDALSGAVKAWFEYVDSLAPEPKKQKAPHVPNGSTPTDDEEPTTRQDRQARALARLNAEQQ